MHRNDRNALVLCRWDRSQIYSPSGEHFLSAIQSHNPDSAPFHSSSGHVNKSTRWRKYCGCPANMILRLASRDYNACIFRSWVITPKKPDSPNTKKQKNFLVGHLPGFRRLSIHLKFSQPLFISISLKKIVDGFTGNVQSSGLHEPRYPLSLQEQ